MFMATFSDQAISKVSFERQVERRALPERDPVGQPRAARKLGGDGDERWRQVHPRARHS